MSTTDLTPFNYGDHQIRVFVIDGEPWFALADVAVVLGYRDTHNASRILREIEKGTHSVSTPGGEQRISVVNEPGLYRLIMRSRRPEAEPFQDWVVAEVLPAIRKTGGYGQPVAQIPDMNTPEGQLQVAEMLAVAARNQLEQAAEIKRLAPKAEYVDTYVNGVEDATILRIVAKQNQVREQWLRNLLVEKRIIARRIVGTRWSNSKQRNQTLYEYYARAGYESWFVSRDQPEAPRLHNGQMQTTLYVTPIGKTKIAGLVVREGEAS